MHYCFLNLADFDNAACTRSVHLGAALIRKRLTVSYVVDDTPGNRNFNGVDLKATVVRIPGNRRGPLNLWRRHQALKRLAPDYIEVVTAHPKGLIPLIGINKPKVVMLWDEPEFMKKRSPLKAFYLKRMAFWQMRRSDFDLTASKRLQEEMLESFGMKSLYMPYGTYLADQPEDTASPYTQPTAAFMGNFYKDWDHDLLFKAGAILAKRGKKPSIVFMGAGPDEATWKAFAQEHGLDNVSFLGRTTGIELWRRLRHAHVLLFPIRSTRDNRLRCPSKTFAYAQARRPIITNKVGEVAAVLGDSATYVDETPEAFAEAIERAFDTPDLRDVDYGIERHSYDRRSELLLNYLQQI